jgi:signal transduction histidine kinase
MLTAWVINNAQPLLIDADGFRERLRSGLAPGYTGVSPNHWMGMPLMRDDGHAVGAMVVQTYDAGSTYSGEDQDLFMLLANDVAVFIERLHKLTWLEQAVKDRTQSLHDEIAERARSEGLQRALYEISELLAEEDEPTGHYAKLHEIIGRLLPAQNFFICTHAPQADHIEMVYFIDQTEPGVSRIGEKIPLSNGLTSLVVRTGKSWLLDQRQVLDLVHSGEVSRIRGSQNFVHWLGVPMILEEQTIGAIVTQSYDASVTYSQHDVELLNFVARHIAENFGKARAREALQKTQRELLARNGALSDALANLQSAQGELVRQERLASLGALVAGVAHEINTPLGICVTAASHLEEELRLVLNDRQRGPLQESSLEQFLEAADDAVRILKSNTQRAAKLIHSFKQVSVDQASGEMRLVNLAEYFNEVVATLGPTLKHKPVSINIHCPGELTAYTFPGALAQVLTNLVMNAVIHGFEGKAHGVITLTVAREGESLSLQFSDDGHGMEPDALNKLFDPFYTTKRGTGGSGLGANIVYNLITGPLAGRVQATSVPGQGLRYDIRTPGDLRRSATTL